MSGSTLLENVACFGPDNDVLAELRTPDELRAFDALWRRKRVIKPVRRWSPDEHFTHKLRVTDKKRSTLWFVNAQGLAAVLSKGPVPLYHLDDPAAFNVLMRIWPDQASQGPLVTTSAAETVLNKANLDRVKRRIIEGGRRCTYSNMYNHNPCLNTERFAYYLNPDPGPDGHPQWNIDCDPARGDFNTLVVLDKAPDGGYSRVTFLGDDAIVIQGPVSPVRPQNARAALESAVQQLLADAPELARR